VCGRGKSDPPLNKRVHSLPFTSHIRYSPFESGGLSIEHSEFSPATPFGNVVVLKENQVREGRAVTTSMRSFCDQVGARNPVQLTLRTKAGR